MVSPVTLDEATDLAATALAAGEGGEDLRHLRHGLEKVRGDIQRRGGRWRAGPLAQQVIGPNADWDVVAKRLDHAVTTLAAAEIVCDATGGPVPPAK